MAESREQLLLSDLLAVGRRDHGDLYAVLDGARDEAIHGFTREVESPWMYLEDGIVEANYQICAPRIVALEFWPPETLERFVARAWGQSWGIFLRTKAEFHELRRHLRRLTSARLPNGRVAQFRFYDPRVLRVFLPTCTTDELAKVFGPIAEISMEAQDPGAARRFRFEAGHLVSDEVELGEAEPDEQGAEISPEA